jgi:hypothetical protein
MPSGAYDVTRKKEVRSHDKIPDGEDCRTVRHDNGDGTFSESQKCTTRYREEPVYDDKCYFTIDRWTYERKVTSAGNGTSPEPQWPDTAITKTGQALGAEREGKKTETYSVTFSYGEGESTDCEMEFPRWLQVPEGVELDAETRVIGGGLSCPSIKLPGE